MSDILTKDQLWRVMLKSEPKRRTRRHYLWGGIVYWLAESASPAVLAVLISIGGLALGIGFMFGLCVIAGACQ